MQPIKSLSEFNNLLKQQSAVLAYFSHSKCSVCETLKPKLAEHFAKAFPKISQAYINIESLPELAAQHSVFTVPVVIVFFEGTESFRKARSFGVNELSELVDRPYKLMFE